MTDIASLEKEASELVEIAKRSGAEACDVVVASGDSLSVSVRDGNVETSNRAENNSLSLRVMIGKKVASVNSNTRQNPQTLAERAVAMARVSPEDPFQGLADPSLIATQEAISEGLSALDLVDRKQSDASQLETMALEAETSGLAVEGVSKSMGSGASWGRTGFVLATSDGFSGSYERSGYSVYASMVAGVGTGMERDYDFDSATHLEDLKSATEIGESAGQRVAKRVGPRQVKSGVYPIIF
ncbi:MAG: DNA gyrase modulator, partial [Pseudomonadota bacterium]